MARKATKAGPPPTEQAPVQRTLSETYHSNGDRVYEYSSETHAIRIATVGVVDKEYTSFLLRKLAVWLTQTPPPPTVGDPWAADDEPPF